MDLSTYIMAKKYTDEHGGGGGGGYSAGTGINITGSTISVDADSAPTKNSQKPVTSGGTKSAIDASQNASLQMLSDTVGWTGKNELPITFDSLKGANTAGTWNGNVYSRGGRTFTVNADLTITVGVGSGEVSNTTFVLVPTSQYTNNRRFKGCPSGGGVSSYMLRMRSTTSGDFNDTGNGVDFTPDASKSYIAEILVMSTADLTTAKTFEPMLYNTNLSDNSYSAPHASVDESKANNSAIAPVENGTTASQAYAQGEHFMRNGDFCTAKTAIASGATLTENSNYTVGDVGSSLYKLESISEGLITSSNTLNETYKKVHKVGRMVWIELVMTGVTANAYDEIAKLPTPNAAWISQSYRTLSLEGKKIFIDSDGKISCGSSLSDETVSVFTSWVII